MGGLNWSVKIGDLLLPTPVITASGTFGYGEEYRVFYDINQLGGIVIKGLTVEPTKGNPQPRIAETPAGMLNAIGLENPGLEEFERAIIPKLANLKTPVIVNILGSSRDEFKYLAERLASFDSVLAALELNISCPNVAAGGMAFGQDADEAYAVTKVVRAVSKLPLIVKLSPNVTDITAIAQAVESAGADAISLINTVLGMAIDVETRRPFLGNVVGGLSGPCIKPIALRMVWEVYKTVQIPLIGMGGIMSARDALEFALAGAAAVAIGTGSFVDPCCAEAVQNDLAAYLRDSDVAAWQDLVGAAHRRF